MKVWGIRAAFEQPLPTPTTPGFVELRRGAESFLVISWDQIPVFPSHEWLNLAIDGEPVEFDHGNDSWSAPPFVRCLYLRTTCDRNHYVAVLPKVSSR